MEDRIKKSYVMTSSTRSNILSHVNIRKIVNLIPLVRTFKEKRNFYFVL